MTLSSQVHRGLVALLGGVMLMQLLPLLAGRMAGTRSAPAGALTPYVLQPRSDAAPCRSEACFVVTVRPQLAFRPLLEGVRFMPGPTVSLYPPSGQVFALREPQAADWAAPYSAGGRYLLGFVHGTPESLAGGLFMERVAAQQPGYVRSARLAGRDQRLGLDGKLRAADGTVQEGTPSELKFSELVFQPMNRYMTLEWSGQAKMPAIGSWVHLHPQPPETAGDLDSQPPESAVRALVLEHQGYLNPPRVVLQLEDDGAERWLSARVRHEQATGEPAFPERMWLQWKPADGAGVVPVITLPASAVSAQADGLLAWAVVEGQAVPLWLRELRRSAELVVVAEQPGALGLPVRPADWARLDSGVRAGLLRLGTTPRGDGGELLRGELPVVRRPPPGLQAGQPLMGAL